MEDTLPVRPVPDDAEPTALCAAARGGATEARRAGAEWLRVDHEPHLAAFHTGCGFRRTAGLIDLTSGTRGGSRRGRRS